MKFKKKMAVLLALAMTGSLLAGCGSSTSSGSSAASTGSTSSAPASTASSTPAETPVDDVENIRGSVNQQTYPIVDSKITLSYWYPHAASIGELSDFNESEFYQWYEEKTNIHVEFIVPAANTEKDAFNLLFASDDMPDMLYTTPGNTATAHNYRGGEDRAIEDGYFIDMAEYLDIAPNYNSWIKNAQDPTYGKSVYSDQGRIYGFWGIWNPMYDTGVQPELGLAIRRDFLEKVGKEIPTTYDEWHDVLTAFKTELGLEVPFTTSKYGIDPFGEFMAGFGTAPYFYQKDGQVKYGPMDDEYKEYLTMLNQWYSEGILDNDFPTRSSTGYSPDSDIMLNDKVGAAVDWATRMSDTYVARGASNPDYYLVACPQPTRGDGTVPHYRSVTGYNQMSGACQLISADSKNIEAAIRWSDGFYADEISQNANYGLESQEGVVWFRAEDGHRIGDYDFRYKNPDGISAATVLVKFWVKNPLVRAEAAQIEQADENKQASYKTWATYDADWYISNRSTMTSDESTKYASMYTDIETYVQESIVKFITGSTSLDTYDSFRDTLTKMGIDDCIALHQAALDRYNAR